MLLFLIPRLDIFPTGSYSLSDILYLSAGSERGLAGDTVEAYATPAAFRVRFPISMTVACHIARDVILR